MRKYVIIQRLFFLCITSFFVIEAKSISESNKKKVTLSILFVVKSFPVLAETPALNQITGLLDLKHNVHIYSVKPREYFGEMHPYVNRYKLLDRTYFQNLPSFLDKFDIIFIDGLHHADQVYQDILNALEHLNDDGTILCHDMNPWSKDVQKVPRQTGQWTGDCWKAFVRLRSERSDLDMFVITADTGLGVIRNGNQKKLNVDCDLTWDNLGLHRSEWLNLISVEEFYQMFASPNKEITSD